MNKIAGLPQKALLMVSDSKVFEAMEAALKKEGCSILDDFEMDLSADLVVMDSFYLNAGMADFVKRQNAGIFTLLVRSQAESTHSQYLFADKIDETIVFEAHKSREDLFSLMMDRVKNILDFSFSKVSPQEFGTGLWVSVMFQLAASRE